MLQNIISTLLLLLLGNLEETTIAKCTAFTPPLHKSAMKIITVSLSHQIYPKFPLGKKIVPTATARRTWTTAAAAVDDNHHQGGGMEVKGSILLKNSNKNSDRIHATSSDSQVLPYQQEQSRRNVVLRGGLACLAASATVMTKFQDAMAAGDAAASSDLSSSSSFADIAARATQISKQMDQQVLEQAASVRQSTQTIYDFSVPVKGKDIPIADLIGQEFYGNGDVKIKAIVLANIKQDDPVARKIIPELMAVAAKYGGKAGNSASSTSSVVVIASPTDQGYYEPDTSELIRLKLASEYGYGINPATIITDKVNFLGTGAHPLWRWVQSTCRIPTSGVGRIQGNFEKWIIDGRTGLPVRRYPKRYAPLDMADDVQAVVDGKAATKDYSSMPPPRANYLESWRAAVLEAERDTYRFEKGLNVFDQ